ncbi:thermonuclease family protein [Rhizobiales bacterium RZME27]|jgi:micrococcal nuclease|uniref:Thermonuclease family protein n=1 Tax=Endobacterium cereale TaxID=2663029 RepID=A0A6A8A9R7_9HYPH|nr:thermonuclease family protein [Endobacterium cereale]MEB2845215.1 thermonuclease family protein [Endobacterium cereale]MQY45996.1 thermonuclease family protein [Endobacterium cereale]
MSNFLSLACALLLVFATEVLARDEVVGPVEAEILRVVDGDTLLVEARPWPQQRVEVYVRIRGIDAPEIRSNCQQVREAGAEALRVLENLAERSAKIQLTHISGDKYFGRIVADVALTDGSSAAESMRSAGVVRDYYCGRKQRETCGS